MNRLFRIILVLCLPTIAVAAVVTWNIRASPRPSHETAVEKYVAYRRSTTIPTLTIKQYAEARMPQNFRPEMSKNSFGNAIYYRTTQRYYEAEAQVDVGVWPLTVTATTAPTPRDEAQTGASVWPLTITTTPAPTSANRWYGSRPMPYPPNDLWCAQLSSPDPDAPRVVLAGLHQDMYNAEWIVHEVTDPETVLAAVGCQFSAQ